jgi:hypothetical protein
MCHYRFVPGIPASAETFPVTELGRNSHRPFAPSYKQLSWYSKVKFSPNCPLSLIQKLTGQYLVLRATQQAAICRQ